MNKIKFLPIVLFASAITLASCNFLGGSSSKKKSSKKSSSGENTSLTSSSIKGDSGSSKSGSTGGTSKSSSGSSSKSSGSSGKTSGSSGKTSSSSGSTTTTSGGGETTYTLQGVIEDICIAVFENVTDPTDYYQSDGDGGYVTAVNFGEEYADEQYLSAAVTMIAEDLPDYCESLGDPKADTWEDGSNGYFQLFSVPGDIVVQLGSYVDGALYCQINVY